MLILGICLSREKIIQEPVSIQIKLGEIRDKICSKSRQCNLVSKDGLCIHIDLNENFIPASY